MKNSTTQPLDGSKAICSLLSIEPNTVASAGAAAVGSSAGK